MKLSTEQFATLRVWIQREAQMVVLDNQHREERFWGRSTFEEKRKAAEDEARRLLVAPTGPGFRSPPIDEDQIAHMVNRFLGWRLPEDFRPDNGITFTPTPHQRGEYAHGHWPVGTNLFDAMQATAMVRYMIEGLPTK